MELRAKASISWMCPEKSADMYLSGRSRKTFPTYEIAWRKMWCHAKEIGKMVWLWSDMEFAGHLILLNDNGASENMFKQASAVMTMLKDCVQLETLTNSSVVQNVKCGVMKEARERAVKKGRKEKSVMTINHVRLLIGTLFRKPTVKVKPSD